MKKSAGILLYRLQIAQLQVLLVHPGGPFWAKKDLGVWTIPKGEVQEGEDALEAAKREFLEETGKAVTGKCRPLTPVKQNSGKQVQAWAVEGDFDVSRLQSNTFEMPWPPRSGKTAVFPEVDKAQWFSPEEALVKILPGQQALIRELQQLLGI